MFEIVPRADTKIDRGEMKGNKSNNYRALNIALLTIQARTCTEVNGPKKVVQVYTLQMTSLVSLQYF